MLLVSDWYIIPFNAIMFIVDADFSGEMYSECYYWHTARNTSTTG